MNGVRCGNRLKKIEAINQLPKPYILEKNKQYVEIQFIKKLIQKEIGQME